MVVEGSSAAVDGACSTTKGLIHMYPLLPKQCVVYVYLDIVSLINAHLK